MRLVIDANIIIAALIKNSTIRSLILQKQFELLSPEFVLSEIHKHKQLIIRKSGLTSEEYTLVINTLFEAITIVPKKTYQHLLLKASKELSDQKDVPFLALALATQSSIWSDDKGFFETKTVKTFTTRDILEISA